MNWFVVMEYSKLSLSHTPWKELLRPNRSCPLSLEAFQSIILDKEMHGDLKVCHYITETMS